MLMVTPSNFCTFAFHTSNSLVSVQCGMILLSFAVSTESLLGVFTKLAFSISSAVGTQLWVNRLLSDSQRSCWYVFTCGTLLNKSFVSWSWLNFDSLLHTRWLFYKSDLIIMNKDCMWVSPIGHKPCCWQVSRFITTTNIIINNPLNCCTHITDFTRSNIRKTLLIILGTVPV